MMSIRYIGMTLVALALAACVDHRPLRNGLSDDAVYLGKEDVTAPNPKIEGSTDNGWLFKVTVASASSPNVLGDYAFPGLESSLQYVKFRFREEKLQVLDARKLQTDQAENPNDDLATSTDLVLFEFDGEHVDVQLRENLDGEKTNFVEENTEKSWQDRKYFKVDFEKMSVDPVGAMAWYYPGLLAQCAELKSLHLVPNSYKYEPADQAMYWQLEANYALNVTGGCWSMTSMTNGTGTATIRYAISFYRPGASTYKPEVIGEKDEVNKKYGVFQVQSLYKDSETGLLSAKQLIQRWDPQRKEPVVFYFHKGFPQRFKAMYKELETSTNKILADAGASLRFTFKEWNDGGIERNYGDIRYSFVAWHQDIDTTLGLLGYGPSSSDPRTGEVYSANLNLYNVGMDYYRFLIQDYLEENGGLAKPDATKPWEQIACKAGETVAPPTTEGRLRTTLFDAMRKVMDLDQAYDEGADPRDLFLPTPARGWDAFLKDYHRLLPELRYVEPGYNPYVWRTQGAMDPAEYEALRESEAAFRQEAEDIVLNQNPFDGMALHTREGIEAQLDFHQRFRTWREDVKRLEMLKTNLIDARNIYTVDGADAIGAVSKSARQCTAAGKWESDAEYSERIITQVVNHVAVHEFGHNVGLRHNFYGSVDTKHMPEGELSSSVMDYVRSQHEAATDPGWGPYDVAALSWIYGTPEKRAEQMKKDLLYCTDEHRLRSPLCYAHDLGVTPAQIVLNAIEDYDLTYKFRNKRAYRTFWDTSAYYGGVYTRIFEMLRMYYLAVFDWGGGNIQDTLKRLDQLGGGTVLTNDQYDEIAQDFSQEAEASVLMITAFFDAVVNQSASFRNYATEFDPYYGDPLRLGIIFDKLVATEAFMDLHDVSNYNPNVQTYVSIYDSPYTSRHQALGKRVLDNMLGASYDTFPWFKYYAMMIFGAVSNDSSFSSIEMKDRIAIRRFESLERFVEEYGAQAHAAAKAANNPGQLFEYQGEQYVYTYLEERGFHLVAGRSSNPVSFKFIRDYNERLNELADDATDNYGLKIMLAYYEYFNNFSGY
jgi:hypothetical protein